MKHLKLFEGYELDGRDNFDEIQSDIVDIFQEMIDENDGLSIDVREISIVNRVRNKINIEISTYKSAIIDIAKYKEVFIRLNEYLNSIGYIFNYCDCIVSRNWLEDSPLSKYYESNFYLIFMTNKASFLRLRFM